MKPHASGLVELGIPLLALFVVALVLLGVAKTSRRGVALGIALAAASWLTLSALLAASGFFAVFGTVPPRFIFLMLPSLALPLLLAFSSAGRALSTRLPVAALVLFHAFRLPLELVMHRAAAEGTMPPQMTYTGSNFDIVSGITALLVGGLALFGAAPRWLLLAWNALGSVLLAAILAVAVASLPQLRAFGSDPAHLNTWVAYFPFVWLPAGLVSSAVLGHAVLWRRLLPHGMRGRALELS